MPQRTLPNELLSSLFETVKSPNDLAHLCCSCKTFSAIVKPVLYSHVQIKTKHHRQGVKKSKKEDVKLIKEVSILGNTSVWDHDVAKLDAHFDGKANTEGEANESEQGEDETIQVCELGAGCVRELVAGKLFKLDSVETIVVQDIHEQPRIEVLKPQVQVSVAKNLHTLAIISHRGGAHFWESVLKKKNLPSLRQLTVYDMETFTRSRETPPPQYQDEGRTILSFGKEETEREGGREVDEFVVTETVLSKSDLLDQLEILVSAEYPVLLRKELQLSHLAIIAEDAFISDKTKYAVIHVGNNVFTEAIDNVLLHLEDIVNPSKKQKNKKYALEYISVVRWAYKISEVFDEILEAAEAKGIKVCYDADDNSHLVPQSFINYLAEKKEKN